MLSRIAWRNILRNKRRSLILVISLMIGGVALMTTDAISIGMMQQMLTNQIGADAGYIQVHKKGYQSDPVLKNSITDPGIVESVLDRFGDSLAFARRLKTYGLISSAYNSSGTLIVGIEPSREERITTIHKYMVEGTYLTDAANQIMISRNTADKLEAGIGDKVVIMASRPDGSVGSEACRICGLFETFDDGFDQTHVFVSMGTARQMLAAGNMTSEFVVNPSDPNATPDFADELRTRLPAGFEVLTYREMLPLLVMQLELYDRTIYIFYAIIGFALIFGIINTMLMAVMERTHEFGVSMAVGMQSGKIFRMILTEAFFLGIIGTVVGAAISFAILIPLAHSGWNLASFSASLKSIGLGTTLYPVIEVSTVVNTLITIPLAAVIGALYPAARAIRMRPVDAIRAA